MNFEENINAHKLKIKNKDWLDSKHTFSMEPILLGGDKIKIEVFEYNQTPNLELGEIVLYLLNQDNLVAHRVVRIKQNKFHLKGDNNLFIDSIDDPARFIGKVVKIRRDNQVLSFDHREKVFNKFIVYLSLTDHKFNFLKKINFYLRKLISLYLWNFQSTLIKSS